MRWWDVRLKTKRQTHLSERQHQHPATKGITWRQLNPLPGMSLHGGTGSDLNGRKAIKKNKIFLALWLGNVYLDRLDCFISNPQSNAAPGAGAGEMALHPLQGRWACWCPQGCPQGSAQSTGTSCCLQLSNSQMGLISRRLVADLCQEGFPPAAWTKAMVSLRLTSPGGRQELLILSIPVPLTCSLSLLSAVSPRQHPGDTSPCLAPKGVSRSHVREQRETYPGASSPSPRPGRSSG